VIKAAKVRLFPVDMLKQGEINLYALESVQDWMYNCLLLLT